MQMQSSIGLDLGGSSAKIALVTARGEVVLDGVVAIPSSSDPLEVLAPVAAAVDELRQRAAERALSVVAVGCGFSGYLDGTRTRIEQNNTPALNGFALAPWLQARFDLPVALDNDACMAALAETVLRDTSVGQGQGQRVLFVTVGSGIGVVLVADGAIARIMHGVTGDAGHIVVAYGSEERCPMGCRGCLETVASARAIARAGTQAACDGSSAALASILREQGAVSGADVSRAAIAGDEAARGIMARAGHWLGVGLAGWACVYAPDLILLGGGVAQAGEEWLAGAMGTMRAVGMPFFVDKITVARAALGNRAGVIGAALLALRRVYG